MARARGKGSAAGDRGFAAIVRDRIVQKEMDEGLEALSEEERVVFHAFRFDFERGKGGLGGFFLSIEVSRPEIEATLAALRSLEAAETATVLEAASGLFRISPAKTKARTWDRYLKEVDPEGRLGELDRRLPAGGEDLIAMMDRYILRHRDAFDDPLGA